MRLAVLGVVCGVLGAGVAAAACGGKVTNGVPDEQGTAAGGAAGTNPSESRAGDRGRGAGGALASSGGRPAGIGGGEPGGRGPGSNPGGGFGTGGFVGGGGVPGAAGAPIVPPPPPPPSQNLGQLLWDTCLDACSAIFSRCGGGPDTGCEISCETVLDTLGPCPAAVDAFRCIGARVRQLDDCVGDFVAECISMPDLLAACQADPFGTSDRVCSIGTTADEDDRCTIESRLCDGRTYVARCVRLGADLAECRCSGSDGAGGAVEVALGRGDPTVNACAVETLQACGYTVDP